MIIEIKKEEDLAKIKPENIHCVYLGDDCVHFRAFALENVNVVCYEVSDTVQKEIADAKFRDIINAYPYEIYYLGMGHDVRMRKEYYKPFKRRIKNAEFYGYRESFGILFDLIKNKTFALTKEDFFSIVKDVTLGHAVGDALGVPVEFMSRSQIDKSPVSEMRTHPTIDLPKGSWSDDTSMVLCEMDSLAKGEIDYHEIMQNFSKWYYNNEYTPTGYTFDIGLICMYAIKRYNRGIEPTNCGGTDEYDNGNGSLMRIFPFALYLYAKDMSVEEKMEIIHKASSLTHAHKRSQIACGIYSFILWKILDTHNLSGVIEGLLDGLKFYRGEKELNYYLERFDNLDSKKREEIKSAGYVVDTLEASIWCLLNSASYRECVELAVNLGDDTDTIGAIAGSLAGALYGEKDIPKSWVNALVKKDEIIKYCKKFSKSK